MLLTFLKQQIRLDSPLLVLAVLTAVAVWWWRRPAARGSRRLLVAWIAAFYLATTPPGANALVFGLSHGLGSVNAPREARGADTVVVLGGGAATFTAGGMVLGELTEASALRVLEGARVYKAIGARLVIVSGGIANAKVQLRPESEIMAAGMVQAGVPADRVVEDNQAINTHDHPRALRPILDAHQVRQFVLVTSPTHMRRALAVFRAAGFDPVPSVSLLRSAQLASPLWLMPNDDSASLSSQALYDYAAWALYWWRGWLA